jgi:hypothetical protein
MVIKLKTPFAAKLLLLKDKKIFPLRNQGVRGLSFLLTHKLLCD